MFPSIEDFTNPVTVISNVCKTDGIEDCILTKYIKFCRAHGFTEMDTILDTFGNEKVKLTFQFPTPEYAESFKEEMGL